MAMTRTRHLSPPPTEIRDAIAEKPTTWPARVEEDAHEG